MPGPREFSNRHGFRKRPEETVREDAPQALRSFVLIEISSIARRSIHEARDLVCQAVRYIPNPANQSVSEIWDEIAFAINRCEWYLVYDLIEEIYRHLQWKTDYQEAFVTRINEFFDEQNLGWQLRTVQLEGLGLNAPQIVIRGSEDFEQAVLAATDVLQSAGRKSAKSELEEALRDLSRRPEPDLTGAVHHAIAGLESVAADTTGESGETLGQVVKRHPERFPAPLGDAVSKLYGFASARGRHVIEGKAPNKAEAELIVHIAAALTTFLLR